MEKSILGILPGILKLKKISKYFLAGNIKIRINLKILIFRWKILEGGKTPLNLLFFSATFSNSEKLI
jgi:hypothetical protein